jgi:hypothetical protein
MYTYTIWTSTNSTNTVCDPETANNKAYIHLEQARQSMRPS